MTGALPKPGGTDEILEPLGGFDTELGPELAPVVLIHPHGFRLVAFGKMNADEGCLRGLAQGLGVDGSEGGVDRLPKSSIVGQPGGERFERVESKLMPIRVFDQDPIVVPVRQEISRQCGDRGGTQVEGAGRSIEINQSMGDALSRSEIDRDVLGERKIKPGGDDRVLGYLIEARDRGTEAGEGVTLCGVRP